jgi:outer membrane protein OmpA-like peptidoglycan-associated protein/uncharacterized surface protein with fasciclin (FAS1) repeats
MTTVPPISPRRYRRRILGLGAAVLVVTFAIGAVIFIPIVQNDLEDRVEEELVVNGIEGVTASFSGQDGTLTCAQPLSDPGRAKQLGEAVSGVRVVDVDRTCSDEPPAGDEDADSDAARDTAVATDAAAVTEGTTTTAEPPTTEPEAGSINELVVQDPLFSQLSALLDSAQLTGADGLGGDGPFTVLAPTDDAFDAAFEELGADAFGALTSDPELLTTVLQHHVTEGHLTSTDFVAGPLDMLDGSTVDVDPEEITFTSGDTVARVADPETQLDIEASNGVVHAIDRLLIPEGLDLSAGMEDPTTTAAFSNGQIVLTGVVASEEQRQQLNASVQGLVDPANVIDELTIEPAGATAQDDLDLLATLVSAMPPNLVSGTAVLESGDLSLVGTYSSDAGETALTELAASSGIDLNLSPREVADATSAQELQDELNEFVRLNPVLFEPNSSTLTPDANVVIEQIAGRADRLDGTMIIIVGHTDTDGSAVTNQQLSEGRAASVFFALVVQGLAVESLSSEGRGGTEPVLVDGVEDKAASRRVEFVVQAV